MVNKYFEVQPLAFSDISSMIHTFLVDDLLLLLPSNRS